MSERMKRFLMDLIDIVAVAIGVVVVLHACDARAKVRVPDPVAFSRIDNTTFLIEGVVVRTAAPCSTVAYPAPVGVVVEHAGGASFLVFYGKQNKYVLGVAAGSRWVPSKIACEVAPTNA